MSDLLVRGPLSGGVGAQTPGTAGIDAAMRVQAAHGDLFDAAYHRRLFSIDSGSVTVASANATASALGTAKFIVGFFNPFDSGKLAVIQSSVIGTVSGTPAGPYFYNYFPGVVASNSATGTIRSTYLGTAAPTGMVAETGVVLTVIGGATPNLLSCGVVGGLAASAVGAGVHSITDQVNGAIIVPPGTLFGVMATGAGTSHVLYATLTWEEVVIV